MTDRFYMYYQSMNGWVLTYLADPVLDQMLTPKQLIYKQTKDGENKPYWFLSEDVLKRNLGLLDQMGYQLHEKSPIRPDGSPNSPVDDGLISASYVVSASSKRDDASSQNTNAPIGSKDNPYDIVTLSKLVGEKIRNAFGKSQVWVVGEISGASEKGGYVYLELVQTVGESAKTNRFRGIIYPSIWRAIREKCSLEHVDIPKNGDKICALCEINFFEPYGQLQLRICDIDPKYAEGEFIKQRALIIDRLRQEGLFELNRSLPTPLLPQKIAVFSSKDAAGYGDFKNKLIELKIPVCLTLFNINVQGDNLEPSFLEAFASLKKNYGEAYFDFAIIMRGGGSMTDLGYFNNYNIAAAIAHSKLKFIAAIGHDKDVTVLDDMLVRCKTPTDGANYIYSFYQNEETRILNYTADLHALVQEVKNRYTIQLSNLGNILCAQANRRMNDAKRQLDTRKNEVCVLSSQGIKQRQEQTTQLSHQLQNEVRTMTSNVRRNLDMFAKLLMERSTMNLDRLKGDLEHQTEIISTQVHSVIMEQHRQLMHQTERFSTLVDAVCKEKNKELDMLLQLTEARDPRVIMKRGFVCLKRTDGTRITSIENVNTGENVRATLVDGHLDLTVNTITENEHG